MATQPVCKQQKYPQEVKLSVMPKNFFPCSLYPTTNTDAKNHPQAEMWIAQSKGQANERKEHCRNGISLSMVVQLVLVNKIFFKLWNEEYRDGIKTRGNKIRMTLCIVKQLNHVRRKFSAVVGYCVHSMIGIRTTIDSLQQATTYVGNSDLLPEGIC